MSTMKCEGSVCPTRVVSVLSISHVKFTFTGIYWGVGIGMVMQDIYLDYF